MNLLYLFIDRCKNSPQNAIKSFSRGLENDIVAVENAIVSDRSSGLVEWNNNRIKVVKRTMYGRCGLKLLAAKVMLGYREDGQLRKNLNQISNNSHGVLREPNITLEREKTNWVLDADIKALFDYLDYEWTMKFIESRIKDPNIDRLMRRMLKAGTMKDFQYEETEEGSGQGPVPQL